MKHDLFLQTKPKHNPDEIIKSAAAFLSESAPVTIGGVAVPHVAAAKPAGFEVFEMDPTQSHGTRESGESADTLRPSSDPAGFGEVVLTAEDRWFPNHVDLSGATQKSEGPTVVAD